METIKSDSAEAVGSVKAAISLFGERINGKKEKTKNQEGIEKTHAHEERYNQVETELFGARMMAKQSVCQIEEANMKANEFRKHDNQSARKPMKTILTSDRGFEGVISQLDNMKRELRKLQLEVKNAFEAKQHYEREASAAAFRAQSAALMVEEIKKKLEEANEEHVIVELARIEAERETREIEVKRETDAKRYKREIESMKEKIKKLQRETSRAKELEARLEATNLDAAVLQNEMQLVRAMETNTSGRNRKEELERSASDLKTAEAELKSARKELESIKEEGFQYMANMDHTRNKIMKIREEVYLLKEKEKKADSAVQNLNSKLLKAKSRLESASAGEQKTRTIVGGLKSALEQIQAEIESAEKQKELIVENTDRIRMENWKILNERSLTEERLQQLVQELERVKASERVAMKGLKIAMEKAIIDRFHNLDQKKSSGTLTISKLEYDYLIHSADRAKFVADKKVAACQAWVEAVRSGEKEIRIRTESMHKEIERLKAVEAQKDHGVERDVSEPGREMYESMNACVLPPKNACLLPPKRSIKEGHRVSASSKGLKVRRLSVSSGSRVYTRSPSFTTKRRRKIVPSFIKFIKERIEPAIGAP